MKYFVGLIFTLLVAPAILFSTPVFADDVNPENPTNTTENPTPETPAEEAGNEWSGEIVDPANTNISEPSIPSEAPKTTDSTPAPQISETITTTTAPATTSNQASNQGTGRTTYNATSVTTGMGASGAEVNSVSSETTTEETAAETTPDVASSDTENSEDATPVEDFDTVLVPETNRPHTAQKIRILALLSTSVVFFTALGVFATIAVFRVRRTATRPVSIKKPALVKRANKEYVASKYSAKKLPAKNTTKKTKKLPKNKNPLGVKVAKSQKR